MVTSETTAPTVIRKNIAWMEPAEVQRYFDAIKELKRRGDYDVLIRTHSDHEKEIHGTPLFLPWHRSLLRYFEEKIQGVLNDPTFGIPYWDWTVDFPYPQNRGEVWNANLMGGAGQPVSTGPFKAGDWEAYTPAPYPPDAFNRQLYRGLQPIPGQPFEFATEEVVRNLLLRPQIFYDYFRIAIEDGPHNNMHNWVGGGKGQMNFVPVSINDPAFWAHHSNVERIWLQYQLMWPEALPPTFSYTDRTLVPKTFSANLAMPPTFDNLGVKTVGDVWNVKGAYTYDSYYLLNRMTFTGGFTTFKNNKKNQVPCIVGFKGKFHAFVLVGSNNNIYHIVSDTGSNWEYATHERIGIATSDSPAAVVYEGEIHLFYRDPNGNGIFHSYSADGETWSAQEYIKQDCGGPPSAGMIKNKICVLAIENNGTRIVYSAGTRNAQGKFDWNSGVTRFTSADTTFAPPLSKTTRFTPSVVGFQGVFHAFYKDSNGKGLMHIISNDGMTWNQAPKHQVSNFRTSDAPSAMIYNDKLHLFYRDGGGNAVFHAYSLDSDKWIGPENIGVDCNGTPIAAMLNHANLCVLYLSSSDGGYNIYDSVYIPQAPKQVPAPTSIALEMNEVEQQQSSRETNSAVPPTIPRGCCTLL